MYFPHHKTGAYTLPLLVFAVLFSLNVTAHTAPLVVLQKTTAAGYQTISATGQDLPALQRINFTCSYSLPVTLIRKSSAICPLPSTVLSAAIDTATSILQISITATTTLTPEPETDLLQVTIPLSDAPLSGDVNFTRATLLTASGDSITVTLQTVAIRRPPARFSTPVRQNSRPSGKEIQFTLLGRKLAGPATHRASGCILTTTETRARTMPLLWK